MPVGEIKPPSHGEETEIAPLRLADPGCERQRSLFAPLLMSGDEIAENSRE